MFKTLRSSLYTIGLTSAVAIIAVLAFALWSFESLGQSAAKAQESSAIVAHVLPPPLYLIEARLVLSQVVEGTLPAVAAADALAKLEVDNGRERDRWTGRTSGELRDLIKGDVATTGRDFFGAAGKLMSAVRAGDKIAARTELARSQEIYEKHRRAIDAVVVIGERQEREAIDAFNDTRRNGIATLLAITLAFLGAAAVCYAQALKSVLHPVRECLALANRVADGDLHAPSVSSRKDELGSLQNALARMTEKLAANRDNLVSARDAAERAGKAKADFLANMSHEIRTPMNAVLGLTHIVLRTSLSGKQREYLQQIQSSGKSLLRIINDVLDFSKIDAGKLELESAPYELDRIFDEVATALNTQIDGKPIELIVRREEGVPNVMIGDALRLKQVLLNLSCNAVKFTDKGEVCISVEPHEQSAKEPALRFSVRDTGAGIPDEVQRQLFQAFTQADTSTTRTHGGTGLGLAISQRIVALMGGRIDLQSTVGQGSTFSFVVPMNAAGADMPIARTALERTSTARHMLKGLNALVVDDNYTARLTMVAMLRSFGLDVTEAISGTHALEVAKAAQTKKTRFAIALVDWRMPDLDGFAVVDELRHCDALASASFIMVSAYDRDVVEASMPEHAPDGLLQKPVTPSTLLDTLYGVIVKDAPTEASAGMDEPNMQLQGRVLLVEDNEINQLVAVALLEAIGLDVIVADDASQAMTQLNQSHFDAVLMDVQMPGMDGFEATAAIRAMERHKNLPIIAMTANSLSGEREKCLAAGMSDYVSKPIEPELLVGCLAHWLPIRGTVVV